MSFRTTLVATGFCLALTGLNTAHATTPIPCAPKEVLRETLLRLYKEVPVSIGLTNQGQLMQVFASRDGGTWTIVLTGPEGIACAMVAGRNYFQQPSTPGKQQ